MKWRRIMNTKKEITIIGGAVVDIIAGPADENVFEIGSQPMDTIQMSFGGDALNEAVVLSRFGKNVELITKVGEDEAGERVLDYIKKNGISGDSIATEKGLDTGINIVLFKESGERFFLTNPQGSLRKLSEKDIEPFIEKAADIVCFASIFVSPLLDISAMERLFRRIKSKPGRILAADLTKAKQGERLEDLKKLLPFVDYIFPNEEEIALLTGEKDIYKNGELLLEAGVSSAVIKTGEKGCLIFTRDEVIEVPAFKIHKCIDTTGAGDTFAAGFLWALSEGFTLKDCGRFACTAASCAVEEIGSGAGIISLKKVLDRYRKGALNPLQ